MPDAFISAGADAEMPVIGKSGDDGHYLFSESVEMWAPLVEDFLKAHNLRGKTWTRITAEKQSSCRTIILCEDHRSDDVPDEWRGIPGREHGAAGVYGVSAKGGWDAGCAVAADGRAVWGGGLGWAEKAGWIFVLVDAGGGADL
jgi:hypothetical protein